MRHPQTNGSTGRLNQTIQNEFYKVAFRKKLYKSIEEIQKDLDDFMQYYNNDRTNQGKQSGKNTHADLSGWKTSYVFENSEEGKTAA